MSSIFKKGSDNLLNGAILGVLIGVLIGSSNIPFIQTAVSWITNLIPEAYHFMYMEWIVVGLLGGIIGYIVDRA
jgi:hypothetical protein